MTIAAVEALLAEGRRLDAERLALGFARTRPHAVAALCDLAAVLVAGAAPVAADHLTRLALVQAPADMALWSVRGVTMQLSGHAPGETARALGRALALTPDSASLLAAQAKAWLDFGAPDRARAAIARARAIDPAAVDTELARRVARRPVGPLPRRFDFLVVPFLQSGAQALHRFLGGHPDVDLLPADLLDAIIVQGGAADPLDWIRPLLAAHPDRRLGLVQHAHVAGGWSDESVADRLAELVAPEHVVLVYRDPFDMLLGMHANQLVHRATRFDFDYAELPWPRAPVTMLDRAEHDRLLAPPSPAACFDVRRPWTDHRRFLREFVPYTGFGRALAAYRRVFPAARVLELRLDPPSVDGFMARLFDAVGLDPSHRDPGFNRPVNPLMARFLGPPHRMRFAFESLAFDAMLLPDWHVAGADAAFEAVARLDAGSAGLAGLDGVDLAFAVRRDDSAALAALDVPMIRDYARLALVQTCLPLMRNNFDAITRGLAPHRVARFDDADERLIATLGANEFRLLFRLAPELEAAWPRLAALVGR